MLFLLTLVGLLNIAGIARAGAALRRRNATAISSPNLRIEGSTTTIYEGPITDYPQSITTPSGGTHLCDGTNNEANPVAAGTCTGALNNAAQLDGFTYDGTYDSGFEDYFITRIASDAETATEFWGLLLNWQFTAVGGCQQEVQTGDDILWAFNAFNFEYFLELTGPAVASMGQTITVTVIDGSTGTLISGASVGGSTTGSDGTATITFTTLGVQTLKATLPGSCRSNALEVVVV